MMVLDLIFSLVDGWEIYFQLFATSKIRPWATWQLQVGNECVEIQLHTLEWNVGKVTKIIINKWKWNFILNDYTINGDLIPDRCGIKPKRVVKRAKNGQLKFVDYTRSLNFAILFVLVFGEAPVNHVKLITGVFISLMMRTSGPNSDSFILTVAIEQVQFFCINDFY